MADWVFAVSPNGLGHFKRVTGLVSHAIREIPNRRMHLFCAEWQLERMQNESWIQHLLQSEQVTFHFGVTDHALKWSVNANDYENQDFLGWLEKLDELSLIHTAELVLSDNLAEVLLLRKDALLMGSFLWGDVLSYAHPNTPSISTYANTERQLLQAHRPHLLCVGDMVMPYATLNTQVIGLPWFTNREDFSGKKVEVRKRVAFLPGATSALRENLESAAKSLAQRPGLEIYFPTKLDGCSSFDFAPGTWASLDAVVCRPGIGTLTDAIKYGVPVIAMQEPENLEIEHNARRVIDLGIGESCPPDDIVVIQDTLLKVLEPEHYTVCRSELLARPTGGYAAATQWLAEYVGLSPQ